MPGIVSGTGQGRPLSTYHAFCLVIPRGWPLRWAGPVRFHEVPGGGAFLGPPLAFVLAAHDEDRARRVMHAVLADRAEQRLGQPAVAAGAHHEQVSAFGRVH